MGLWLASGWILTRDFGGEQQGVFGTENIDRSYGICVYRISYELTSVVDDMAESAESLG